MWPFKAKSTCCSGIVTNPYDCKKHTWGKWELYVQNVKFFPRSSPTGIDGVKNLQRRKCTVCGFIEEEEIGSNI